MRRSRGNCLYCRPVSTRFMMRLPVQSPVSKPTDGLRLSALLSNRSCGRSTVLGVSRLPSAFSRQTCRCRFGLFFTRIMPEWELVSHYNHNPCLSSVPGNKTISLLAPSAEEKLMTTSLNQNHLIEASTRLRHCFRSVPSTRLCIDGYLFHLLLGA